MSSSETKTNLVISGVKLGTRLTLAYLGSFRKHLTRINMSGIQHASNQSIKAFKSSEEYLYAMKEDLAEWLKDLYNIDIDVTNILEVLETGAILCNHANNVTKVAEDFLRTYGRIAGIQLPSSGVTFVSSAQPSTFLARDNISNFINWCRKQMDIQGKIHKMKGCQFGCRLLLRCVALSCCILSELIRGDI